MKYSITKLDGRYSYRENFKFYIGFANSVPRDNGPVSFNDAMVWFTDTYGWSAEVRQWRHINLWTAKSGRLPQIIKHAQQIGHFQNPQGMLQESSSHCNPHWSWTNSFDDLRIYVASTQELAFFQLTHPVDQKR